MSSHLVEWLRDAFPRGGFSRKVATVASGTALGQAVALLVSPLLTRLYSPGDFGLLGFYLSIMGITSTISTFCYEKAIPVAPSDEDARSLLVISLVSVLATTLLVLLVGVLHPEIPASLQTLHRLRPYFWVFPIGLVGLGFHQALSAWGVREHAYSVMARAKFAQGAGSAIFQTLLGLLKWGPLNLLFGDALGRLLGFSALIRLGRVDRDFLAAPRNFRHHVRTALMYRRFPLFGLGSSLLNTAGAQGTVLVVAFLFDPWQTGLFVFADRMIGLPITLITRAASQVFVGEISQVIRERPGAFRGVFRLMVRKLSLYGALLALVLVVVPPLAVAPIFGERWRDAGFLIAILAPAAWAQFVASPLSGCIILLGRLDLSLAWDAGRLLLVSISIWAPRRWGAGLLATTAWYSAALTISYIVLLVMMVQVKPKPIAGMKEVSV